jgi:hypothetical protein
MLFTLAFFKGAAERAIKTGAQTLAGYFVIGTTGVLDFDWVAALSVTAAAMVASLVTSIGNAEFVAGPPTAIVEVAQTGTVTLQGVTTITGVNPNIGIDHNGDIQRTD